MAYDANTNIENEKKYLSNLASQGGGKATWANNQMKVLDAFARKQAETAQKVTQPAQTPQVQQPVQQTPQQQQMNDLLKANQQMGEAQFEAQKAKLDSMLNSQISQLKMAYEQAIADGQISIRDAESQFQSQKQAIEKQAYLDKERTDLYTQDMGIQNSQQAVGLMQGDNARKAGLLNQNMTERDKRVNDVKDRLSAIRKQKDIDLARVQSEYDSGILGARADANKFVNQNSFGLMQDDYTANRNQSFAEKNLETQFQNSLKSATHESNLAIERMNVQQGLDLAKMKQSLADDIKKMSVQFGYSSALNAQEQKNRLATISAEYSTKVRAEEDAYKKQLARDLAGITPGTDEYRVITENNARNLKNKLSELHASTVYEATVTDIMTTAPAYKPTAPIDYTKDALLGTYDPGANIMNWLTGYGEKQSTYDAQSSAYQRKLDMLQSGEQYMPWSK